MQIHFIVEGSFQIFFFIKLFSSLTLSYHRELCLCGEKKPKQTKYDPTSCIAKINIGANDRWAFSYLQSQYSGNKMNSSFSNITLGNHSRRLLFLSSKSLIYVSIN